MTGPEDDVLIGGCDPHPVEKVNADGGSAFLLTGDHAGNRIPHALGTLGLSAAERARHIGWDIGVRGLGERMAERLDAPFLCQRYSRLVVDCNRDPLAEGAMPLVSDGTTIPGNEGLGPTAGAARVAAIHAPYHAAIAEALAGRPRIYVALHSFTPVMEGFARPWDVGVLYGGGEEAFALALLAALRAVPGLNVGDNQPYAFDGTDYSVPHHAFPAALPYAEIEVRQDHVADAGGQERWAAILSDALMFAAQAI